MFLLALSAATLGQPAPGPFKSFGDWAIACDNVRRCEMTSLQPEDGDIDTSGAELSLTREPGPAGDLTISLWPAGDAPGTLTLTIDGKRIASGALEKGVLRVGGDAALPVARALANGRSAQISVSAGGKTATLSLAGASAAMRFLDAQQGRAGGVTALVARGAKPANTVPAAAALPMVPAIAPGGQAAAISPALLARLNKASGCGGDYSASFPQPEPETGALGGGATLVLLACGSGAYNLSSAAYVVRAGKAAAARFDDATDPAELINASWDAGSGTLSTHGKGRGIGDCGEGASYVWDGARFRLTEATRMDECRGSANWLTVWRATVRR
ncbi:DUF1176 domain-containing protein [Sphingomonas pituitosa]|uniref:DUF1176 domain-containing protein n=1 Tax=Sphingomonas pituitosa TaxID=99597 RepID=UPI00082AAED3|nr:DUF1176 domain-containing protein [Sphingomonas pituitosa]